MQCKTTPNFIDSGQSTILYLKREAEVMHCQVGYHSQENGKTAFCKKYIIAALLFIFLMFELNIIAFL